MRVVRSWSARVGCRITALLTNTVPVAMAIAVGATILPAINAGVEAGGAAGTQTALAPADDLGRAVREESLMPAGTSPIRVVVRSYETASIGAEINARITQLPRREGDTFKRGDVIVEFDCRKIVAEHDAAVATLKSHISVLESQRQLLRLKAGGTLAVEQAQHDVAKAEADVRGLEARRSGCQILAPFDGRVIEKSAQIHEIAQPNQPILKIINEDKLELVMMVPSNMLPKVRAGTQFVVRLDENGEQHQARIVQSTGLIDPVSQSARMIAELVGPVASVVPGMSGTATFLGGEK